MVHYCSEWVHFCRSCSVLPVLHFPRGLPVMCVCMYVCMCVPADGSQRGLPTVGGGSASNGRWAVHHGVLRRTPWRHACRAVRSVTCRWLSSTDPPYSGGRAAGANQRDRGLSSVRARCTRAMFCFYYLCIYYLLYMYSSTVYVC